MRENWAKFGDTYIKKETGVPIGPDLPPHVFKLEQGLGFYLTEVSEDFAFEYKLYDLETDFVNRVVKSFRSLEGNLGVLMNGVKGTGKTVTAKLICNALKLPVIIIPKKYDNVYEFINELDQEAIFFFDEYEKMYNNYDHDILTVMDGVLNNGYKRVFLMTTNESYINQSMLQRPGRIRYFKTFRDLSLKGIMEIVEDRLTHTSVREELIRFISGLEIITVDIVKALIDECNIHEEGPDSFKDVFNVKPVENLFDVWEIDADSVEKLLFTKVQVNPQKITNEMTGSLVRAGHMGLGIIKAVLPNGIVVLQEVDDDEDVLKPEVIKTVKIEKTLSVHTNFSSYVF